MDKPPKALVVVIGAGAMGAGIAQVAAAAGHPVRVVDRDGSALTRGSAAVETSLKSQVKRGVVSEALAGETARRIAWTSDLEEARGAGLVIEAVVERLDVKVEIFRALEAIVPSTAILASNTSSLSIESLAQPLEAPARFIGLHFFNPVPVMKLVEVIAGPGSDPSVADAAFALMRAWGKHPVRVRDVPGFIVNRVARPYYAEGFAALGEGVDPALIDKALTAAGGFRMGPLALADMIGHDVNYAVACSVFEAYAGETRFVPQPAQQALFEAGKLGRKSGSGVYDYAQDLPQPPFEPLTARPTRVAVSPHSVILDPLREAAQAVGVPVDVDPSLPAETLLLDETRVALGDGRTLAHRPGVDVLLDLARDFRAAQALVITAPEGAARQAAAGFIQTLGCDVLVIGDRPGQIVLRTLAQLANAAADAVTEAVASAEGIDEAMLTGANHPQGPLAWAREQGLDRLDSVLTNLAEETGEPRYRPADYFHAAPSI